jgi:hypothetical protein
MGNIYMFFFQSLSSKYMWVSMKILKILKHIWEVFEEIWKD